MRSCSQLLEESHVVLSSCLAVLYSFLHVSLVDKGSLVDAQSLVDSQSSLATRGLLLTRGLLSINACAVSLSLFHKSSLSWNPKIVQ